MLDVNFQLKKISKFQLRIVICIDRIISKSLQFELFQKTLFGNQFLHINKQFYLLSAHKKPWLIKDIVDCYWEDIGFLWIQSLLSN
jgi:hypothetical protein